MNLKLLLLDGTPLRDEWVTKPFADDARFNGSWWRGEARRPVAFCSFTTDASGEVARVQIRVDSTVGVAYPTFARPQLGSTEIDLIEVRPDLRGQGFGHEVTNHLLVEFPSPCIAVSLDTQSDTFWRSLGWTEHAHADGPPGRPLFVQSDWP